MGQLPTESRLARWIGPLVIAAVIVVHAPTLVLQTVRYDDHWLWATDSPLRDFGASQLHDIFFELDAKARHVYGTEYLPVRDLVVAGDMAIWGENEYGPHATQLLLFALTVGLLGTLLQRWGLRRDIAWLGTLLWGLHPIHVETVAWLSERKGVLCGLFVVLCGHAWVRFRNGGRAWWLVAAAACAICGVWSKAPAMFAPLAFGLWDGLVLPRSPRRWLAIGVVTAATALAAVPVVIVARDGRIISEETATQPSRIASALGAQGHYIESFVLAKRPSISYPIQTEGPSAIDLAIGIGAVLGSIALVWRWRDREKFAWQLALLAWAWTWFVPISHLLTRVHILVADRFAYLWSLAACIGVAWGLRLLSGTRRLAATAVLGCIFAIANIRAQAAWTSSLELFSRALASNPRDPVACENLSLALADDGRVPDALEVVDACLLVIPKHTYLLERKARLLLALHRNDEALATTALAAESGFSSAMWMHADLLHKTGRNAEALPFAERATKRKPENEDYAATYAEILIAVHRERDAEPVLRSLLERFPKRPPYHFLLAVVLVRTQRVAEAQPHIDIAAGDPALADMVRTLRGEIR